MQIFVTKFLFPCGKKNLRILIRFAFFKKCIFSQGILEAMYILTFFSLLSPCKFCFCCEFCSLTNVTISKLFVCEIHVFLGQILLVTPSMQTILKEKLFGVKIKKIRLLFLKGQRFKDIFFFSSYPAISLTVGTQSYVHPYVCQPQPPSSSPSELFSLQRG